MSLYMTMLTDLLNANFLFRFDLGKLLCCVRQFALLLLSVCMSVCLSVCLPLSPCLPSLAFSKLDQNKRTLEQKKNMFNCFFVCALLFLLFFFFLLFSLHLLVCVLFVSFLRGPRSTISVSLAFFHHAAFKNSSVLVSLVNSPVATQANSTPFLSSSVLIVSGSRLTAVTVCG